MADVKAQVFSFLNGIEGESEIADFASKVSSGGFLRPAVVSHLHLLFSISKEEAGNLVDAWITEEQ